MKRRAFCLNAAALGATSFLLEKFLSDSSNAPGFSALANTTQNQFQIDSYGVTSGDPSSESLVLWTMLPDSLLSHLGVPHSQIFGSQSFASQIVGSHTFEVNWWVAETSADGSAAKVVCSGSAPASAARAFSVKVEVKDLVPSTSYHYGFSIGDIWHSEIGRANTLPQADAYVHEQSFAYVSCQHYGAGFYTVYQALCASNVDFCVHLGDAIYENVSAIDKLKQVRSDQMGEALTLADYRNQYKKQLSDPWYREARRLFTWINIPDDHEFYNNYSGTDPRQQERRAHALQAYFEFMPLPEAHFPQLHRTFRIGTLATLVAMDERQHRNTSGCAQKNHGVAANSYFDDSLNSNCTMLGTKQKQWLKSTLQQSNAQWNVLLSQVMMMPQKVINRDREWQAQPMESYLHHSPFASDQQSLFTAGKKRNSVYANLDAWDGFAAERSELVDFLLSENQGNTLIWTGDIHNLYGGHLQQGQRRAAFELTTASISSPGVGDIISPATSQIEKMIRRANPHMNFVELKSHGFVKVTLRPDEAVYEIVKPLTIRLPTSPFETLTRFTVANRTMNVYFT